jgi:hypothetical protein
MAGYQFPPPNLYSTLQLRDRREGDRLRRRRERGIIRANTRPVQTLQFGRAGYSFRATDLRAAGSFVAYSLSC